MKKYKCKNCEAIFTEEEADSKMINLEVEYGVSHLFTDSHNINIMCCPKCNTEELEEIYIDFDEIEEQFQELKKENELLKKENKKLQIHLENYLYWEKLNCVDLDNDN